MYSHSSVAKTERRSSLLWGLVICRGTHGLERQKDDAIRLDAIRLFDVSFGK